MCRTAATHLFQAGQNVKLIKEITGHVSNAVEKYEMTSDQQRMHVSDIVQGNDNGEQVSEMKEIDMKQVESVRIESPMEVEVEGLENVTDRANIISNPIKTAVEATGNKKAKLTITIELLD